jgi:hypothetical protein
MVSRSKMFVDSSKENYNQENSSDDDMETVKTGSNKKGSAKRTSS